LQNHHASKYCEKHCFAVFDTVGMGKACVANSLITDIGAAMCGWVGAEMHVIRFASWPNVSPICKKKITIHLSQNFSGRQIFN